MTRPHLVGPLAALVALAAVAGCDKKGPECDAMIKVINPAAEKLKAANAGKIEKPSDHEKAMIETAHIAERAAADLDKVPLTVPELSKFSTEYQTMSKSVAVAARDMAAAVRATEDASKQIEKTNKELEAAAKKVGAACGKVADANDQDACKRFQEGLTKLPADPEKTVEIEKVIADLATIAWKGGDLEASSKAVLTAVRANNKVMVDLKAAQKKAEAAQKKIEEAEAKESQVIDGINKFCQG